MTTSLGSLDASAASAVAGAAEETCDQCGFESARWSRQDAIRSIELADRLVGLTIEGMSTPNWLARPDDEGPTIGQQFLDLIDVFIAHWGAAMEFAPPGTRPSPVPAAATVDAPLPGPVATLAALGQRAAGFGAYLRAVDDQLWGTVLTAEGRERSLDALVRRSCHEMMHRADAISRTRHAVGDVVGPLTGTVASLHASEGGVPKPEVTAANIDVGGLIGDAQAARQYHGRPWQALCLWSTEVVEAWAAEGHPIFPGAAGENLSLTGLDWSQLRAGLIVEIGEVTARLSAPAVPCAKNSRWFSDRDHRRLGHDVSPGRARWYASVLTPGRIDQGDAVVVRSVMPIR